MQVLPSWITTILLALLLTFLAIKLSRRGLQTYKRESVKHTTERAASFYARVLKRITSSLSASEDTIWEQIRTPRVPEGLGV